MSGVAFTLPCSPSGEWESLTRNEQAWIEMIRVISNGRDPRLTLTRAQVLRELLDSG